MSTLKIGIDLDGTVFKTYQRLLLAYRKHFGTEMPVRALNNYRVLDPEGVKWFVAYFHSPLAYLRLPVYPDCVSVIQEWHQKGDKIYIVSARPLKYTHLTINELNRVNIPSTNIFIVKREDKAKFYQELHLQVVIEDEPAMVYGLLVKGVYAVIIERDWNKLTEIGHSHFTKVKNWKEVKEVVEKIRKEVKK